MEITWKIGYAFFYERIVIYGDIQSVASLLRSKRMRNKAGEYIGVVNCLIPVDPYCVLYEYHKHTEAFKRRQKLRSWFKKRKVKWRDVKRKSQKKLLSFRG